jgi:serine/threonine-protein kinase
LVVTTGALASSVGSLQAAETALSLSQSGPTAIVTAPPVPVRWGRWALAGAACLFATLGGVFASARRTPPVDPPVPPPAAVVSGPGLPDVRAPEKLTTTRERELLGVLNAMSTKPDDTIKASVELGLLYLKEGRFAEATERFDRLKQKSTDWREPALRAASVVGRLGRAVVLAHENKPEASNKLFLEVTTEAAPKFVPKGPDRSGASVNWLLLRFPDLNITIADALHRNATNLNKSKLEPALEQLRGPHQAPKKE